MKKILVFVLCVIGGASAASKTTVSFSSTEKQIESINRLQNLLIDRHNLAVNDLDTLFTNTANISSAKVTRDSLVATGARVTSNVMAGKYLDASSVRLLDKVKRYAINVVVDFDTSEANHTEQGIVIDSLPTLCRVIDAFILCTDSVQAISDSSLIASTASLGTASGGDQFVLAASCDTDNEVAAMTVTEAFDVAPKVGKTALYLSVDPAANWTTIRKGTWYVYVKYTDHNGY